MEYFQSISHKIGNISKEDNFKLFRISHDESPNQADSYVVCLSPRAKTWIFMPCRHATCCSSFSQQII